jgi:ATP-dependent RNA helicase DeaD
LHLSRAGAQSASPAAPAAREPAPRTERPAPAAPREPAPRNERPAPAAAREPAPRTERTERPARAEAPEREAPTRKERKPKSDIGTERFRIEVGSAHGVKPANIVGAIANEAGLDAKYIGHIEILDDHSVLDLPEGMPKELLQHLKTVWVAGQQLRISHADGPPATAKPSTGKITLTVPKRGAERRVEDKKAGAKPHRKGGKPK